MKTWPPSRAAQINAIIQTAIFRSFGGKPKGKG